MVKFIKAYVISRSREIERGLRENRQYSHVKKNYKNYYKRRLQYKRKNFF